MTPDQWLVSQKNKCMVSGPRAGIIKQFWDEWTVGAYAQYYSEAIREQRDRLRQVRRTDF